MSTGSGDKLPQHLSTTSDTLLGEKDNIKSEEDIITTSIPKTTTDYIV